MNYKSAFTLAEILITLGIIGVVAALTIPTLVQNYQKKELTSRLAQTYSILSQAVKMSQVEYGDISTWGYQSNKGSSHNFVDTYKLAGEIAEKYFLPHLKVAKNHGTTSLKKAGMPSHYNTKDGRSYNSMDPAYIIELTNGVVLMFNYNGNINSDGSFKLSEPVIFVDLNGNKEPNTLGRDLYVFDLDVSQNKFIAHGDGYSRELLKRYCKADSSLPVYSNLYCTALIKMDGWKIADDYPW